ncbi:EAL domain-containing protein [Lysinibacillus sp. LZ02]|uniref:EAL domain-containing protein n=1 Tax=Lysinibacillus sp. LZ02 TaxID=3420668 RepID=UPI003D36D7DC
MSIKRRISILTTALVMFTIIATFSIDLYLNWNRLLDDKYNEVTSISTLLDNSLKGTYNDLLEHPNMTDTEKIASLNEKLQPYIDNITDSYANFGAGYYVKELNSIVAFGPNFDEASLTDMSKTSDAREVYTTGLPLKLYNYSQTRKSYVVANIHPIIRDGEIIGHIWSNVLIEDLFTLFKDAFIKMLLLLFIMIAIGLVGSRIITNQYFNNLKLFKDQIISEQGNIDLSAFSPELIEVYEAVSNSRMALIESEKRFRDVVTAFDEYVWETDLDGRYTYVSERASSILGYSPDELLGTLKFDYMTNNDKNYVRETFIKQFESNAMPVYTGEEVYTKQPKNLTTFRNIVYKKKKKSGEIVYLSTNTLPIFDTNDQLIGYRGVTRDISLQMQHEQHINQLAYFDALTKLPNRTSLTQEINRLLQFSDDLAILFIDLDHFKSINDTLGHRIGDELLVVLSQKIAHCLEKGDAIYRFGGDEFIVVMQNFKNVEEVISRTHRILHTVNNPIVVNDMSFFTTLSIGISLYPAHGSTLDILIKNADMAMYKSKENGKNQYTIYNDSMRDEVAETFEISNLLNEAISDNQFELHYQPQVCITSGKIIGVEALVRWIHPTKGFISPAKFIPIAEESGLIIKLGEWILRHACTTRKQWLDEGIDNIRIAVNISLKQFQQPDFIDKVLSILEETGLQGRYLELEITESIAMNNPEEVIKKLQALQHHAIYISIDDFGMGYSSLNYLKRLPIQQLKIDRAFVQDITEENDYAIVKSIITMAQSLGLDVVAEGVETTEQATILNQLNCPVAQGYLYYKPMPAREIYNELIS